MSTIDQRICLWFAPGFGIPLLLAFALFPGFFPPLAPTLSSDAVAAFYRENTAAIRASMILFNLFGVGLIPFFMVIVVQMLRMASPSRSFAYAYLSAAASGASFFLLADFAWASAAFRPERDAELIQLVNDIAWISFITPVGMVIVQNLALAMGIYLDDRSRPVFPRWLAHFNIVAALCMVPGAFAIMFQSGPLAWDGALAFWLRVCSFGVYVAVMFFALRSSLQRQDRAPGAFA